MLSLSTCWWVPAPLTGAADDPVTHAPCAPGVEQLAAAQDQGGDGETRKNARTKRRDKADDKDDA